MAEDHFDIAIAGAGLVGASTACALAASDPELRIALIEPGPAPTPYSGEQFDPRVVALTRQSQNFLTEQGAWGSIAARRHCPYREMDVWDGEGSGRIHFDCADLHEPDLGHIVENSLALSAVLACCETHTGIELLRGPKVTHVQVEPRPGDLSKTHLTLNDGRALTADLLIAADGANSPVRHQLDFATREWDYGQDAIVTTVRTQHGHDHTARQRFMRTGPLAFLPLLTETGDTHYCSIVWSLDQAVAGEYMALDEDAFAQTLGRAFEHRLGAIEAVAERYSFPLRQRHALDYVQPGAALVGDAAHTIHPLAGQGVNLGLLDARVLASEIHRALQRGVPLNDYSILRRYQRQRKPANLGMMALMEGFKRLFGSTSPSVQLLRNLGLCRFDGIPALKKALARQAMGL